jgi:N-acylneuraminate cytidylyltransferase
MPIAYVLNGAIYIAKTDWLRQKRTFITENTVAFEMPVDRSLDIDEELDLDIFNSLLIKQRQ